MENMVINLLKGAGVAFTPAIIAAIVACMAVKCLFSDDDCIEVAKSCIKDILGIEID